MFNYIQGDIFKVKWLKKAHGKHLNRDGDGIACERNNSRK